MMETYLVGGIEQRIATLESRVDALYKGLVIAPDGSIRVNAEFTEMLKALLSPEDVGRG